MNAPAQKWTGRLVEAVLTDSGDAIMHERLDALVRWLAGVKGPESESITLEFEKRDTSERQAQQLALVAIDPILFDGRDNPWTALGLAPGTAPEAIKQRYYRLTKIYHPDRQLSAEEWLNERAEKINRAYEQVKRGRAPASADTAPRTGFEPAPAQGRPTPGRTIAIDRREAEPNFGQWLREMLGGAHRLQRNAIITAATIAAVVLALFALQDNDPYIPRTTTNTQTTEPDPTPRTVDLNPRVQSPETNAPTMGPEPAPRRVGFSPPEQAPTTEAPNPISEPSTPRTPQPALATDPEQNRQLQHQEQPKSAPKLADPKIATNQPNTELDSPIAEQTATETPRTTIASATPAPTLVETIESSSPPNPEPTPEAPNPAEPSPPALNEHPANPAQEPVRVTESQIRKAPLSPQTAPILQSPEHDLLGMVRTASNAQPRQAAPKPNQNNPQKESERLHQKARFFLANYANLYTEGNADALAGLYDEDARQEKLNNRSDIRGHYERFFRLTESRELYFQLQDVVAQQEHLRVTAGYTARLTYKGGRAEQLSGNASFKLNRHGNTLSIQEAAY